MRGQVRKRLARRLTELGLPDLDAYRARLDADPAEWGVLEGFTGITISRFFRDRHVWDDLAREVLPSLLRTDRPVRAWSAGCASGEEPYSLVALWHLVLQAPAPLEVVATDRDPSLLERARRGCYPVGALREVPEPVRAAAFEEVDAGEWCVREDCRRVDWVRQDLRTEAADGPFDLVLCRNLAFTYFDEAWQRRVLDRFAARMPAGSALVVGTHEVLPASDAFAPWPGARLVWQRSPAG